MDENKKNAIKAIRHEIECANRVIRFIQSLPDDLPGEMWASGSGSNVHISIPADWELYREIRYKLGSGWRRYHQHTQESTGRFFVNLQSGQGGYITIVFEPDVPNSICEFVQTGEMTIPTYEMRCM